MSYIGNTLPANFQSLPAVQRFNGDGSDTTFTLAAQIANDQSILVSVDGVTQDSNAYSVSGTTLTFTSAPSAGTGNIFVNTISPVGSTITHPASDPLSASTGTFSGGITATAGTFNGTGGQITTDNSGHITSKQSLDVATAGGRFIGNSNRGQLGHVAIEQTANSTDGGYIRFATSASGSTSPTDRMRIDGAGNVGIGTTSPSTQLHIENSGGNASAQLTSGTSGTSFINMGDTGDTDIGQISYLNSANAMAFTANAAERVRITSTGNVGIGTTGPGGKLTIEGTQNSLDSQLKITASGQVSQYIGGSSAVGLALGHDSSSLPIVFKTGVNSGTGVTGSGSERMRIGTNARQSLNASSTTNGHGNFVGEAGSSSKALMFEHTNGGGETGSITTGSSSAAYNTSSDYRLKENVVYDWDATTRLKQLKPARFNFIIDADKTVDGFLAHEAQAIVPESVTGTKDEVDEDGVAVMQSIDNSKLVPLLVKTIQELEARLTAGGL